MSLLPLLDPVQDGDDPASTFLRNVPPLRLFKTLAHAPGVGAMVAQMGAVLLFQTKLDPRLRELAILRAAYGVGNAYEIGHHVRIGREVGLDEAQLRAAETGDATGLANLDSLVLQWADQVVHAGGAEPGLAARAIEALGAEQAVELSVTVGYYLMVAQYLQSFAITFEGQDFTDGVKVR